MRLKFWLITAATPLALIACATKSDNPDLPPPPPELAAQIPTAADWTGVEWHVEDIEGAGVIDNSPATLMVTPEGNLSGNASCNRMFGGGKIAGDTVAFGMIGATKMACAALVLTDQEQRYLAALGKVAKWRMENGLLFFTDAAGKDVLRFSR